MYERKSCLYVHVVRGGELEGEEGENDLDGVGPAVDKVSTYAYCGLCVCVGKKNADEQQGIDA